MPAPQGATPSAGAAQLTATQWQRLCTPTRLQEVTGVPEATKAAVKHALGRRQIVLLTGPPGAGKTAVAEAAARELGFASVYFNCDDPGGLFNPRVRTELLNASRAGKDVFGRRRCIIVDGLELLDRSDGVAGGRGSADQSHKQKRIREARQALAEWVSTWTKRQRKAPSDLTVFDQAATVFVFEDFSTPFTRLLRDQSKGTVADGSNARVVHVPIHARTTRALETLLTTLQNRAENLQPALRPHLLGQDDLAQLAETACGNTRIALRELSEALRRSAMPVARSAALARRTADDGSLTEDLEREQVRAVYGTTVFRSVVGLFRPVARAACQLRADHRDKLTERQKLVLCEHIGDAYVNYVHCNLFSGLVDDNRRWEAIVCGDKTTWAAASPVARALPAHTFVSAREVHGLVEAYDSLCFCDHMKKACFGTYSETTECLPALQLTGRAAAFREATRKKVTLKSFVEIRQARDLENLTWRQRIPDIDRDPRRVLGYMYNFLESRRRYRCLAPPPPDEGRAAATGAEDEDKGEDAGEGDRPVTVCRMPGFVPVAPPTDRATARPPRVKATDMARLVVRDMQEGELTLRKMVLGVYVTENIGRVFALADLSKLERSVRHSRQQVQKHRTELERAGLAERRRDEYESYGREQLRLDQYDLLFQPLRACDALRDFYKETGLIATMAERDPWSTISDVSPEQAARERKKAQRFYEAAQEQAAHTPLRRTAPPMPFTVPSLGDL